MVRILLVSAVLLGFLSPLTANAQQVTFQNQGNTRDSDDSSVVLPYDSYMPTIKTPRIAPPKIQEKPLSYWFGRLASKDPLISKAAKRALKNHRDHQLMIQWQQFSIFDPEYEPKLGRLRHELRPLLCCLITLLDNDDSQIRSLAISALVIIGTEAEAARPALWRIIYSGRRPEDSILEASEALLYVSPGHLPIVPELWCAYCQQSKHPIELLTLDSNRTDEYDLFSAGFGAVILTSVLANTRRTTIEIPALAQIARSKTTPRGLRLMILETFGSLKTDARAAIPVISDLLNDEDPFIRITAAFVLISMRESRGEAERIIQSIKMNDDMRIKVQKSLDEMFKSTSESGEFMRRVWRNETNSTESNESKEWNERWQTYMKKQFQLSLRSNLPFYQREALRDLGEIGEDAKWAIPDILQTLSGNDPYTREAALEALKQIDAAAIPQWALSSTQVPIWESPSLSTCIQTRVIGGSRYGKVLARQSRRNRRR